MNSINQHRVSALVWRRGVGPFAFQQPLIVCLVVSLMETCGKAEIGKLDVAFLVNQDVIWFDITVKAAMSIKS